MKEKEAIEILAQIYDSGKIPLNADPAFKLAIKALKKIQALEENETYQIYRKYLSVGTVEEFKVLKEKNEPKKPVHQGCYDKDGMWHEWNGINSVPYDLCPNCGINLCTDGRFGRDKSKMKYCENCGQKLDWKTDC